ncbi:recombinase family protein [Clostridium vitabionis]|uniref:recombinase family protein n=1 Tax=Clostridium vitabionis TaxID=2784388 RepID=UPI0022A68C02|nr:recombinase family protein [Clostridium vitabionis]
MEIQENQAKVVKEIFHLYMDGKSVDDIREQLYEEGIFTPNGEKKKWSRGSVTGVLHQGKYTGDVTISASDNIGSQVVMTEAIPAIISEDTFQKVQRKMEKRTRRKVKK